MARTLTSPHHLLPLLLVLSVGFTELTALGCAGFQPEDPADSYAELDMDAAQVLDHPTALGVLALVNDPVNDVDFLDEGLGLDSRAATRIVAHRQGPDGLDGTADDDSFGTIIELDDVGYVGEATLELLGDAAWDFGYVPVLVVEGVAFSEEGRDGTLLLANEAELDELDVAVGLDKRAAEAIVAGRPYAGLMELAERPWVGPATLASMLRYAEQQLGE